MSGTTCLASDLGRTGEAEVGLLELAKQLGNVSQACTFARIIFWSWVIGRDLRPAGKAGRGPNTG
jgi:hypothetical protein